MATKQHVEENTKILEMTRKRKNNCQSLSYFSDFDESEKRFAIDSMIIQGRWPSPQIRPSSSKTMSSSAESDGQHEQGPAPPPNSPNSPMSLLFLKRKVLQKVLPPV